MYRVTGATVPLKVLARGWRTLVATALVGAAVGIALALLTLPTYTSSVTMQVRPQAGIQQLGNTNQVGQDPNRVVATQGQLVLSDDVVNGAAQALGLTPTEVRNAIGVTPSANSDNFVISATGGTPQEARDLAARVTGILVTTVRAREVGVAQQALDALNRVIASATVDVNNPLAGPEQRAASAQRLNLLQQQRATLEAQIASFENPVSAIRGPDLPSGPSTLGSTTAGILGALLGLLAGCAVVAVRRLVSDRCATGDEVAAAMGAPVVARVPSALLKSADPVRDERLIDSLRSAAVTIELSGRDSVTVSSAGSEDASALAAALAVLSARSGRRVVLVAAAPESTAQYWKGDAAGLGELLANAKSDPVDCLQPGPVAGLSVLPLGRHLDPDAVRSRRFAEIVRLLAEVSDLVIVLGPPLARPEALAVSSSTSGLVLAVDRARARRSFLETAVDGLVPRTPLLGVIDVAPSGSGRLTRSARVEPSPVEAPSVETVDSSV